jgi:hypothetical protein
MTAKIEIEFLSMVCIMVPVALLQATESINYGLYSNIIGGHETSYMKNAAGSCRSTVYGFKA